MSISKTVKVILFNMVLAMIMLVIQPLSAVASEPFIGEIKIVGFIFAPRGWADCDGQLLPINENSALFSLLGTTYGGDGRTTFQLPDLRGRVPVHYGTGAGLTSRTQGQKGGAEQVVLTVSQLASHSHNMNVSPVEGNSSIPTNNYLAKRVDGAPEYLDTANTVAILNPAAITNTGGNQPVAIMQPYLTLRYIIALQGIYPSRN